MALIESAAVAVQERQPTNEHHPICRSARVCACLWNGFAALDAGRV